LIPGIAAPELRAGTPTHRKPLLLSSKGDRSVPQDRNGVPELKIESQDNGLLLAFWSAHPQVLR